MLWFRNVVVGALLGALAVSAPSSAQSPPGTPTRVQVLVAPDNSVLNVSWMTPPSFAAPTAHRLDFFGGTPSAPVASVSVGPAPQFTVAIPPGVQGRFSVTVTALAGGIPSAPSPPAAFTLAGPTGCNGPPAAPGRLRFTRVGNALEMIWDAVPGASEYVIEAGSISDGTDIFVGSVGLATSFTAFIPVNTHAYVRVRARNACGTSLRLDEIEIGAMWSIAFRPGLDVSACGLSVPGGFCSQVLVQRTFGAIDEIWSPMTPVVRVTGTMTADQVAATLHCTGTGAGGTLQATWNGERYVGTVSLGGAVTTVRITPGNFDPACTLP